jgi:hypothetical protein
VPVGHFGRLADKNVGDTADWKVCATLIAAPPRCAVSPISNRQGMGKGNALENSWRPQAADND